MDEQRPGGRICDVVHLPSEEHERVNGRFVGEEKLNLLCPSGAVQKAAGCAVL